MRILALLMTLFVVTDTTSREKPLDGEFLREYALTRGYLLGRPVKPMPTPDGSAVLYLRSGPTDANQSLFEFDLEAMKTREILNPRDLLDGGSEELSPEEKARRERMRVSSRGFANFQLNHDGSQVMVGLSGRLFIFDRTSGKSRELKTGPGTIVDPKWSPDGQRIAYVKDYDVFAYDLMTDREWAVTTGGTVEKTHGMAEFVAQEEMGRFTGYWFSPDSKSIAYQEADASGVEVWHVGDPNEPASVPRTQFYPRPGKANVQVRLGIKPIEGGETTWVEWDRKSYEYLTSVRWDKAGPLTIAVQDRLQQKLVLLNVDPATGETTELLTESDPAFLNINQGFPRWLKDGTGFVWLTEDGEKTLVQLRHTDGTHRRDIWKTTATLNSIGVDPESGEMRTIGGWPSGEVFSDRNHVYGQPAGTIKPIFMPRVQGSYSATYSNNLETAVYTGTHLEGMPKSIVVGPNGKSISTVPSVAKEPSFTPDVTIEQLGGEDGYWTAIVKPHGFDPAKKYPVIVNVYGGPRHVTVRHAMRDWLLSQWLADQGFIVVAVDNRGTPGRGRNWERAIYQKFGSVPLEDQVKGLKLLGAKHPQMDLDRVGIVGWSFGGYMSALAVLKRPDVFKAAVAGAPVTDWKDYDTHYTERYMGLLPASESAYEEGSLIPLAPKLERPLLLVHGTADDNVYFRHTLKLTDALFRAGKDFEVLPLPSLTHMVPDPVVTEQLWSRIARHFEKHLGETP